MQKTYLTFAAILILWFLVFLNFSFNHSSGGYAGVLDFFNSLFGIKSASETIEYDTITLDFRYLRDYFTPQVSSLGFHREIKCKHFSEAEGNCANAKLKDTESGVILPDSFVPSPFTSSESSDQQNGIITWKVPKTTKFYLIFFNTNLWDESIWALFQHCPTNKAIRCGKKLQENTLFTAGISQTIPLVYISFQHVSGRDETVHLFGVDQDVILGSDEGAEPAGGFLTGKHSVRFVGDEVAFQLPLGWKAASVVKIVIDTFNNFLGGSLVESGATLDQVKQQIPVRLDLARCSSSPPPIYIHVNISSSSELGKLLTEVAGDIASATGGFIKFSFSWNSGLTYQSVANQESDESLGFDVCDKNSRCGEDSTNDIVFSSDMPYPLYATLANEDSEMSNALLEAGLDPDDGVTAATNWYGFTGSAGNNDIAVIVTEADIIIRTDKFDLTDTDQKKLMRMVLAHELSHHFVGRGANEVLLFDENGKPFMLSENGELIGSAKPTGSPIPFIQKASAEVQTFEIDVLPLEDLLSVYSGCSEETSEEEEYHPLISVEEPAVE